MLYKNIWFMLLCGKQVSCQLFVKTEFTLDSALACGSDKKHLCGIFVRNFQSDQIKHGSSGFHEMFFMP